MNKPFSVQAEQCRTPPDSEEGVCCGNNQRPWVFICMRMCLWAFVFGACNGCE